MPLLGLMASLENIKVDSLLVIGEVDNGLGKPLFYFRFFFWAGPLDEGYPPFFTLKYISAVMAGRT